MNLEESLNSLLTTTLKELIDNPDDLNLDMRREGEEGSEDGYAVFVDIHVNPSDIGKVIGRQGRTIKSLRTISRAVGARSGARVEVEIIEDDKE